MSTHPPGGDEPGALQRPDQGTEDEPEPGPDPPAQQDGRSGSPGNIIDGDGVPVARPAEGRWPWFKAAAVSTVVLAALAAVLVMALSWGGSEEDKPAADTGPGRESTSAPAPAREKNLAEIQALFEEANRMAGEAMALPATDDPGELLNRMSRLRQVAAKYDEVLALVPAEAQKRDQLRDLLSETEQRQEEIAAWITGIEKQRWPVQGENDQPQDMFPRVSAAIPIVQHAGGRGSGFVIEHEGRLWVVTNRHVVAAAGKTGLQLGFLLGDPTNPTELAVRVPWQGVEAIHKRADLALISLDRSGEVQDLIGSKQVRPLKLLAAGKKPRVMDKIWIVGHPGGLNLTATAGAISAIRGKEYRLIQIDAMITHGSSGCPVFDRNGRVIGIASHGMPTGLGSKDVARFAVHVDMLRELLEDSEARLSAKDVERAVLGTDRLDAAKVAAAYARHKKELEAKGWKLCALSEVAPRVWGFEGKALTQYTVLAVSDPQHQMMVSVRSKASEVSTLGTKTKGTKVLVDFRLNADAPCLVIVIDPPQSRSWPLHVGVFRLVAGASRQ